MTKATHRMGMMTPNAVNLPTSLRFGIADIRKHLDLIEQRLDVLDAGFSSPEAKLGWFNTFIGTTVNMPVDGSGWTAEDMHVRQMGASLAYLLDAVQADIGVEAAMDDIAARPDNIEDAA